MSIFEIPLHLKVDDTVKLACTIETAHNIEKHTEYILRVVRGHSKNDNWTVSRRYRDFSVLHSSLQQSNVDLPLPPKKLIGNMQPSFIAERQVGLQDYLNKVLAHPVLSLSLQVRNFLDPKNYPLTLPEQALQTISIALRGDGKFGLKGPLPSIGWRIRKSYFMVTETESKTNCLLSWQSYGPDRCLCDKDLQALCKSIQNISHPFIDEILAIHNLETGLYVIRRIHENGTLKDMIYGTEYNRNNLAKYANPKGGKSLTNGQIIHYSNQILTALKFLSDKGLPHAHIHPGNIAIENKTALLMETENFICGVPSLYRQHLMEIRKSVTAECVDVYCFGRTLYEMALGAPLEEYCCDNYPASVITDIENLLRMCISYVSVKHHMPKIFSVITYLNSIRNGLAISQTDGKGHAKIALTVKEELKKAVGVYEARLKAEQKILRCTKKEVRIKEILNSEEEMKHQKKIAKKRDKIWKSTSSLAETLASHSASTASSPTPPTNSAETSGRHASVAQEECGQGAGRSALLDAICGFDKSRLSRVNSS